MTIAARRRLQERVLATADRPLNRQVYWLCRNTALVAGLFYFRIKVRGKEHLRTTGPAILAPAHRSNLDVPLIAAQCPRRLRSLAKDRNVPGTGEPLVLGIHRRLSRVKRDQLDRVALETAATLLDRGEMVLVFPEGTRSSGPEVGDVHNGCAYLATVTGVRVIPIGLAGTDDAMPPGARIPRLRRIVITIGDPIEPANALPGVEPGDARTLRRALSARVRAEMQRLLDESREALAALPQRRRSGRGPAA